MLIRVDGHWAALLIDSPPYQVSCPLSHTPCPLGSETLILPLQLFCPEAGGSGLPELMAYLNGTNVRRIFSLRTYVIKFFSCLLAVASGLPVGPEGPMIALGFVKMKCFLYVLTNI